MRIFIFFIFFFAATGLSAQNVLPIGKGWQLSIGLEINQQAKLINKPHIYVSAADTLPIPATDFTTLPRFTSEVDLGGGPMNYYSELNYDDTDRLAEPLTQFITNIQLHRRGAKNLEHSFGLYYAAYRRDQRLAGHSGLPEDYFVIQSEYDDWRAGVRSGLVYNFFYAKRFQPFVGINVNFGVNRSKYIRTYRQFPLLDIEQDIGERVVERFRINTIFDLDLSLAAGANYRLSEHFAVGLNAMIWGGPGVGSVGVQLRYLFMRNQEG